MKSDFQFSISPTQSDLTEIERWLIEEDIKFGKGFYCNWSIIEKAFTKKELITINFNSLPIGFLVWSNREIYAEIDILEIEYNHRNKGIGKYFFDHISNYLKEQGFLAIKLFCAPRESEKFWKKLNFLKYPNTGYSQSDLTYYKPLVPIQEITNNSNSENKLELWNVEPFQIKKYEPKWTWEVQSKTNKLPSIIVQPCNPNWNLRWTKNSRVIREDKVKYFFTNEEIDYSTFLIIKELVE